MRAGAQALSLLAAPMNADVLTALAGEPRPLIDLRRAVGSPPQTTMRGQLRALEHLGIVERSRGPDFPGTGCCQLAPAGRDLLEVLGVLADWLACSPDGCLQPGSVAARSAIKALVGGWASTMVRALAAKPLSLTELSRLITSHSYPALERRLGSMRLAGQIEPRPGGRRGTPYVATDWLRRAIAPLAAAACWERSHEPPNAAPLGRLDVEAAFLLAAPMLRLPAALSGTCRLVVAIPAEAERRAAGATFRIADGRVVSCSSRLADGPDAWADGPVPAWLRAVGDPQPSALDRGGQSALADGLLAALHEALVGVRQPL